MKRSEQLAWAALAGLLTIAVILITGGFMYRFTAFWAGGMLAVGQALVVGLAAWGLSLSRQAAELNELPPGEGAGTGFRMSSDDTSERNTYGSKLGAAIGGRVGGLPGRMVGAAVGHALGNMPAGGEPVEEIKTLDTSFQRLVVVIAGILLALLSGLAGVLVYWVYHWARQNPDLPVPIAGSFAAPRWMDELGLLMGLACVLIYGIFYWLSRPKYDRDGSGDALSSNFALGATAMAALGTASVLGYFRVAWASELAAGVIAFFMLLQGLELIVNSMRSYSSIEELDQEAVDLQAHPLGPMLGSVWLAGLRMLFAQSVGLSGQTHRERGVIARLMPRTLVAIAVIAIGVSCLRVVQPGNVAVLERLGYAPTDKATGKLMPEAILHPGLHLTLPWPIDQLVTIPTEQLQLIDVGTELHAPKEWKGVDFQFWTIRDNDKAKDTDDLFITGDVSDGKSSPQILETYVQVRWRVADPAAFYNAISHSEFYEKGAGATKSLPIYEAIVQQCTSFAVTRTFAIHSLEQIMTTDRQEVEAHCREILQKKLDSMGSGIEIAYLTIKDLHPPYWRPDRYDTTEPRIGGMVIFADNGIEIRDAPEMGQRGQGKVARGPASAFEFVISMREFKEQLIDLARGEATAKVKVAEGFAESEKKRAQAYSLDKIARAHGDADRLVKMTENMDPKEQRFQLQLMEQQLLYTTLKDLLDSVGKIIVDSDLKDVQIYQTTDKGVIPVAPIKP